MGPIRAAIFDVGNVLFHWHPRYLYERLIDDDRALDAFLRDVVTHEWHFQHDAGRPFAETSAELVARFPQHRALIAAWQDRFTDSMDRPVAGMTELLAELDDARVPMFAITNFSGEFFPQARARWPDVFGRFRDIVVSGDEKLLKPDAAIYRLALDRFGLAPDEAMFVDDNAANVAGAEAMGIRSVLFTDWQSLRVELADAGLLESA